MVSRQADIDMRWVEERHLRLGMEYVLNIQWNIANNKNVCSNLTQANIKYDKQ
jgi:hypothetical protein